MISLGEISNKIPLFASFRLRLEAFRVTKRSITRVWQKADDVRLLETKVCLRKPSILFLQTYNEHLSLTPPNQSPNPTSPSVSLDKKFELLAFRLFYREKSAKKRFTMVNRFEGPQAQSHQSHRLIPTRMGGVGERARRNAASDSWKAAAAGFSIVFLVLLFGSLLFFAFLALLNSWPFCGKIFFGERNGSRKASEGYLSPLERFFFGLFGRVLRSFPLLFGRPLLLRMGFWFRTKRCFLDPLLEPVGLNV